MKKIFNVLKSIDYRHYICATITVAFILINAFVFPYTFPRLGEAFRDFGLSIGYYFAELFQLEHNISPSVTSLSKMPFTLSDKVPQTWEVFKEKFTLYWQTFSDGQTVIDYFLSFRKGLLVFSYVITFIIPVALVLFLGIRSSLNSQNNRYNEDTKPLKAFKKISDKTYRPIKAFLISLFTFVKEYRFRLPTKKKPKKGEIIVPKEISYIEIWTLIWILNFNLITIALELFAYYFYFVTTFDFLSLYTQVYKLLLDLSVMFKFVPVPVWILLAYVIVYKMAIRKGYDNLNHNERQNLGFLNNIGIINEIYGYVGAGKTALCTDMALSFELKFIDDALEILLETDMRFPYFPWINLEMEIRRAIRYHVIYDKWSCWRWVDKKFSRWIKSPNNKRIFDYDYERYGISFDDKLSLKNIWQAISDYTCAYVIYIAQTSYIISNYSIRSDILENYIGNFPLRNTDFFKRDSKFIDSFSRFSHILDQDMLRLGKIMLENNPNRNAFGWGIYVISEIDKERKNTPELQEVKKNSDECNQKNDLMHVTLTISRHACIVANRVFVRVIGDLQRVGALGSNTTQLGDLILVKDKSKRIPVLPFYSPFWFFDGIFSWIIGKFENLYLNYRYNRADNSLIMYILHSVVAKMSQYRERIYNLFGTEVLTLEIDNGLQNGEAKKHIWYRSSKKVFSDRYATDCMSAIFRERGKFNTVGLDDLAVYADIMATNDERELQHSHMQEEFSLLQQNTTKEIPKNTFLYFSNGEVESVEYSSIPELKEIIAQAFFVGKITESGYAQILARFAKLSDTPNPIQDFKDWLSSLYVKGTIKADAYKLYYDKIEKIRCPQR